MLIAMKPDFSHPHFADPAWLALALLGPVALALLLAWAGRARARQLARLAAPAFLADMLQAHSPWRRQVKHALLVLAVFLLGLALARPQWGRQQENSVSLGEDVVFLLDCSASMDSTDVKPTRLARAKLAIADFAQQYHNGRIGLVAFAGQAFLQCPLTFDFDAFRESLNAVDDQTIPVPGTDIGRALAEGYAAVAKNDRRKILVLVSDGEDLEQGSIRRAKDLAAKDVTIYTVGIGTPDGSRILISDQRGGEAPLRDASGQIVISKLDEPTLRAIAEATHGTYQPLGPIGDGLNRVRLALSGTEGMRQFITTRLAGVDHFHFFVAVGLGLLVLESLLGTRRSRPVRAGSVAGLLLAGLLLSQGQPAQAADADTDKAPARDLYNEGTAKLKAGNLHDAETSLNAAVPVTPDALQPLSLYNLGSVRFRAGQEILKNATQPDALKRQVGNNLAGAGAALKAADTALNEGDISDLMAAYQQGRMSNHNLNQLQKNLKGVLETYDKTLARWMRSWGDFKSATELKPGYTNAQFNADVVDRNIAALNEQKKQAEQMQQAVAAMKQALKQKLGALKGKLPGNPGDGSPGGKGDDGDEDDNGKGGDNGDEPGKNGQNGQENQGDNGSEQALTPEEAMRMLLSMHTDLTRKYSFGDQQPEPPKKPPTKPW